MKNWVIVGLAALIFVLVVQDTIWTASAVQNLTRQVVELKEQIEVTDTELKNDFSKMVVATEQLKKVDEQLSQRTTVAAVNTKILAAAMRELFGRKWDNWLKDFNEKAAKAQAKKSAK